MFSIKHTIFFLAVIAASGLLPLVAALDFTASKWIWTTDFAGSNTPSGDRAFRKTVYTPAGKVARNIDIIITVDNFYTLYVNGATLGGRLTSNQWQVGGRWCVAANPSKNVVAVKGANEWGPAGVLAAFQVIYTDGSVSAPYVSNTSWNSSVTVPSGFEQPAFNDAAWPWAVVTGDFNVSPYNAPISFPAQSIACLPTISIGGGGGGHLNDSAVIGV